MFYQEVFRQLKKHKVSYAVVGGLAVSLQGAVRGTVDLDIVALIDRANFKNLEKALLKLGLQSRLPVTAENVYDFREEYIENKNLVAWSFYNPKDPSQIVDVIITFDLKNLKVDEKNLGHLKVPVLTKRSLIEMKKESGRAQDLEDIKALEKLL